MLSVFEKHFKTLGYSAPTLIQAAVYQPLLADQSVLALAPTGSGKTVAFTLPALAQVLPGDGSQVLVLEPSQELAIQTARVMRDWAKLLDIQVLALTGGANVKRQMERLKKRPEVIVGTPGRVLNLLAEHKVKGHLMQLMIVDEADDLLTGDTLTTVREITNQLPADLQLGFFSATDTAILHDLPTWFGQEIQRFDVRDADQTQGPVAHQLLQVGMGKRAQMLKRLLAMPNFRALVFFNQAKTLRMTATRFHHEHVSAAALTSDLRQVQREKALTDFRQGRIRLLLTTDVAARGLDIPKLPAVVNFDLPTTLTAYVHRVGRTGRMGEPGLVISLGDDHDLRDLKKLLAPASYSLETVYFNRDQLQTTRPSTDAPANLASVQAVKPPKDRPRPAAVTTQPAQSLVAERPKAPSSEIGASAKRHKKHKHSKNKGMRKKRRDQAAKPSDA